MSAPWLGGHLVRDRGNVNFSRPIQSGELVEATARVIHTGRTSIPVLVNISTADTRGGEFTLGTHCILVFVAVDSNGRPQAVPKWEPHGIEDLELAAGAESRITPRARIHDEMRWRSYTDLGTAPRITLRFLAAPSVANFGDNAHGGTVLRWIDEAARTCATGWAARASIAVYSGGTHFCQPIHIGDIGDIVEVEARLIHTS